ncbi:hypothetical protein Tco_0887529 [Tanacetum coccineum]
MTTLVKFMIIAGADNHPPMLEKSMYDFWNSRMELYIENKENGIIILNLVQNGPLVWPTIVQEDDNTWTKKYEELSVSEKLQADCDLKATNIVLQGLPPYVYAIVNHHKAAKHIWDGVKLLMQGTKLSLQESTLSITTTNQAFIHFTITSIPVLNGSSNLICLAVPVFTQGDDPIACLNKSMVFLLGVAASRFPSTNAAFQTEDLDAYDYDCDDVSNAKAVLMANLSNYGSDVILEIKPSLYDGSVISSQHVVIPLIDEEETLILEEILVTFVPQQEISTEQDFWLQTSNPNTKQFDISPARIKAPSELPKVSLVNTSLKKLKVHLSKFNTMVKKQTTPDAITEGEWGSESCDKCFDLDAELLKKENAYNELLKSYSQLEKHCFSLELTMQLNQEIFQKEKSCDNQILRFQNILKDQLQAKDTTISKLKEHIKSMREDDKKYKVKQYMDEIETINIELEHSVAKLFSENELLHKELEHLKQIYKDQFDSIKKTRACSKEYNDSLIAQLNSKSMENADLKRMFKLDIEPISHRLKNNRDAHEDNLKKTIENTDTICGLVECARKLNPSEPLLDSACMFTKHVQELLVYVSKTCPSLTKPSEKLVAVTPLNKNKKVRSSFELGDVLRGGERSANQGGDELVLLGVQVDKVVTRRNVEGTVDIIEFFRKIKFVCHKADPFKDLKWSNVPGFKLSSLSESDDTFSRLQALSNLHYLFGSFIDYLWSRKFYQWYEVKTTMNSGVGRLAGIREDKQ